MKYRPETEFPQTSAGLLRSPALAAAALWTAVSLLAVCVAGCGGGAKSDSTADTQKSAPPPDPLFQDWPQPDLALVLSGQQYGHLEPCGCTERQSGGLGRRMDLFRLLRDEKGWPVAAFDLGGTVERSRRQSQIKFETMLSALRGMGYGAVGVGPAEVKLGPLYLLSQHTPAGNEEEQQQALALLGANVTLLGDPELGVPRNWTVLDAGGLKIGATAVVGESAVQSEHLDNLSEVSIAPPEQTLPGVLEKLEQEEPDLRVLLSYGSLEESRRLAERFPQFDVVLSAGEVSDPDGEPEWVGETILVDVGHKGKYVGVVGYFADAPRERLRFELVELDADRFEILPKMNDHMRDYQERLKQEQLVKTEPPIDHPRGTTFVGAKKCGECHTKAYSKWKTTRHSHAFESLIIGRKGRRENWVPRTHDPECLACHVTGWKPQQVLRYRSGFVNAEFQETEAAKQRSQSLRGQQCENCHGPGSRHVELEELWKQDRDAVDREKLRASRKNMQRSVAAMKEGSTDIFCYRCHDLDNSPNFDFEEYWEKVEHRGTD